MSIHPRLKALGLTLPKPPPPAANYEPLVQSRFHLHVSGQLPLGEDGQLLAVGKVGAEVDLETAQRCARQCALNALAVLDRKLGGGFESDVVKVVRLGVFVASTPDFTDQHLVANAASDLFNSVLNRIGGHARAAVGCISLPLNAPVEVEVVVELLDETNDPD